MNALEGLVQFHCDAPGASRFRVQKISAMPCPTFGRPAATPRRAGDRTRTQPLPRYASCARKKKVKEESGSEWSSWCGVVVCRWR